MIPQCVTIHCTATENGKIVPIETIRQWHIDRGWKDIGYHIVIQPDGEVNRGRPLNEMGAHVEGHNLGNIGICLVGGDKFTRAQFDALRYQIDSLAMTYDIKPWDIRTHCQYDTAIKQGKSCPNIEINRIVAWYVGHYDAALMPNILQKEVIL